MLYTRTCTYINISHTIYTLYSYVYTRYEVYIYLIHTLIILVNLIYIHMYSITAC